MFSSKYSGLVCLVKYSGLVCLVLSMMVLYV